MSFSRSKTARVTVFAACVRLFLFCSLLLFVFVECVLSVSRPFFSFNCCTLLLLRCPLEMCPLYCTFFLYAEHHRCQNRTLERKKKTRTREKEDEDKTVTRESAARWSTRWLFTSLAVTYEDADFFFTRAQRCRSSSSLFIQTGSNFFFFLPAETKHQQLFFLFSAAYLTISGRGGEKCALSFLCFTSGCV